MPNKRVLVLASGTPIGGGSGFENLVSKQHNFAYEVIGVASNLENGGVRERAKRLNIPFMHIAAPWSAEQYQRAVQICDAEFVACSGWLKPVRGLDPSRTINIHPGALPRFGGKGMWGHHVHEATIAAYQRWEIAETEINMHFVTDFDADGDYDRGPVFFKLRIPIWSNEEADSLAHRVNELEHLWQPRETHQIVTEAIRWSSNTRDRVIFPPHHNQSWSMLA